VSNQSSLVTVTVNYGTLRVEFSGTPESVLLSINSFLAKQIPAIDLASRISVTYGASDLVSMFGEVVRLTPEGPRVWKGDRRLSDKEIVTLQLVAARIAHDTGRTASVGLTLQHLAAATGIAPKSISSRLSELTKLGYAERLEDGQSVAYRVTTQGIHWIHSRLGRNAPGR
jgi:DNA-binding transcriptional ArsR family regulator